MSAKTINQMKKIIPLLLLLFQCLTIQAVSVVFRFDDYQLVSDSIQDRLLKTFNKYDIPISLAIIPCYGDNLYFEDGTYLPLLMKMNSEGKVEVALHGLNHQHNGNSGEFSGLSLQKQVEMLSKGKHILDSLFSPTISFVPPWNSYDDNTLIALEKLGFKCISSCMTIGQPLSSKMLQYYPETIDHPNKLKKAIEDNQNRNGIIILMFHAYDFDQIFSMEDLDALLMDLKSRKDVEFLTFKTLCYRNEKSDKCRFKANIEVNLLTKLMKTSQMLQTKPFAIIVRICNVLIYNVLFFIFVLFGRLMMGLRGRRYYYGAIIIMVLIYVIVWWHILSPLKSIIAVVMLSIIYVFINMLIDKYITIKCKEHKIK